MGDAPGSGRVAVLSGDWGAPGSELAFVVRGVAGALSRHSRLDVMVPGEPGPPRADGAFDLHPLGSASPMDGWPGGPGLEPLGIPVPEAVLTDLPTTSLGTLVQRADGVPVVTLAPTAHLDRTGVVWGVGPEPRNGGGDGSVGGSDRWIGMHVPVNPLAATRRHNGLGETGYVLILTDRGPGGVGEPGSRDQRRPPSDPARWIVAGFPRRTVVVVEDARASVWRSRCLRGVIGVDSRTDLWRLMAHAAAVVDLRPGDLVARECVEALRYGVPVVVPAGTPAARLAAQGGGLWYRDAAGLLGCVEALEDPRVQQVLGEQGRRSADRSFGDPAGFVARVGRALSRLRDPEGSR